MGKNTGRGGQEKLPGHRAAVIPLRPAAEGTWSTIDDLLLPEGRAELERFVCQVEGYLEAERVEAERVDPTARQRDRKRRRTEAKRFDRAVTTLVGSLRALRTYHRAVSGLEPDTARAVEGAAARFGAESLPYLFRAQSRARGVAQLRERRGPKQNYLLEVIADRLDRIVETYRKDKKGARFSRWTTDDPHGVLVFVAAAVRERVPCLAKNDEALYQALTRAKKRLRRRRQVSFAPRE